PDAEEQGRHAVLVEPVLAQRLAGLLHLQEQSAQIGLLGRGELVTPLGEERAQLGLAGLGEPGRSRRGGGLGGGRGACGQRAEEGAAVGGGGHGRLRAEGRVLAGHRSTAGAAPQPSARTAPAEKSTQVAAPSLPVGEVGEKWRSRAARSAWSWS